MTEHRRRLLWRGVGASLAAMAVTIAVAVAAGDFGDTFWSTIGTVFTLFACGAAALAGLELVHRRQLRLLGWAVLVAAPAEAATLILAIWKEDVSVPYGKGLVMTGILVAAGIVVTTLRLIVRLDRPAVIVLFVSTLACTGVLVALAIPLVWITDVPDFWTRVLLVLIVLAVLGYLLTPVVQRLTHLGPRKSGPLRGP